MSRIAVAMVIVLAVGSCRAKHQMVSTLKMSDLSHSSQLVSGFHKLEDGRWRWTDRTFVVILPPPPRDSELVGAALRAEIFIPETQIAKLGPITLAARAGELALAPQTFSRPGNYAYVRDIPGEVLLTNVVPIRFVFDKAVALETESSYPLLLSGDPQPYEYQKGSPAEAHGRLTALGAVVTEISLQAVTPH